MDLDAYFQRIGYRDTPAVDLQTLVALHRCQALNVAYENLDVFLGIPVSQDPQAIFNKIVHSGRGGWCYELNGLLGWALENIGFEVTRLVGAVRREELGDKVIGNHLVLRVELDTPWLVDTGIGDGLIDPVPLQAGTYAQGYRQFRLERRDDGFWRLHNRPGAFPASFDFLDTPADEALLAATCEWLQSDPDSPFRRHLVVQRMRASGGCMVRGLTEVDHNDGSTVQFASEGALLERLEALIGALPPQAESLWQRLSADAT